MCTVTYIPQKEGCVITSNRDETVHRGLAELPEVREWKGERILFPKDPLAGGTWIGSSKYRTACLYNGAFEPHQRKSKYRMSRGVVTLEALAAPTLVHFEDQFDPEGIEPFSLVVYDRGALIEYKWDEKMLHKLQHDASLPHIWASVTLYDADVRKERQAWFNAWLAEQQVPDQKSIMGFHHLQKGDRWNGLHIEREGGLRTVSVSSVRYMQLGASLIYHDTLSDTWVDISIT